ncbi:MAG: hypothetical protein CVV03_00410 [Firmicutes bacterium HGW-Firmicutes-8]|nr:MAG: hypothetical protein CVV03_00410 [Firmicutes bacterium HGW-Firmicutes-8]
MIKIENFSFWYSGQNKPSLDRINFQISAGEFVVIAGRSGCGKTTLLNCLNGIIPHLLTGRAEGQVIVAGQPVAEVPVHRLSLKVGTLLQNPEAQFFTLTVRDEVAFGLENLGFSPDIIRERVEAALIAVSIQDLADSFLGELSGGQKQRVAIASVLAMQPQVLVFDEPTSDLDPAGKRTVAGLLKKLQADLKTTIIVVEHDLAAVGPMANRLVIMNEGKIVLDDLPQRILGEKSQVIRSLGLKVPGTMEENHVREGTPEPVCHVETGRNTGKAVLNVDNVSFTYKNGRQALNGVSLELKAGEFLAVAGSNGAGKSTLAYLLAGLYQPRKGRILIRDRELSQLRTVELAQEVGLLFQNPDNQLFCATIEKEVRFGLQNFKLTEAGEVIIWLLNSLGLAQLSGRHPQAVSRGQRQRVALAAVLALQPKLLVLDEPSTGQDWGHLQEMMNLLAELRQRGTGILMISHDWDVITGYADRVIVLEQGRVIFSGTPRNGLAYCGL